MPLSLFGLVKPVFMFVGIILHVGLEIDDLKCDLGCFCESLSCRIGGFAILHE
jgi:hypothetical protein